MPRLASSRGLRTAALVIAPLVLALAAPTSAAAAAAVAVTPAPEGCGLVVALTGFPDGAHTAVVTAKALATGDPLPVAPAVDPTASASPAPAVPALSTTRTVVGDSEVVVVLDAAAVPDADPRVSVAVTVDGQASPAVELAVPSCGVLPPPPTSTPTPTPSPTGEPTAPPPADPTTQPTTERPAAPEAQPTSDMTGEPAPASEPTTGTVSAVPAVPSSSASPLAPAVPSTTPVPNSPPEPTTSPAPEAGTQAEPVAVSPVLTDEVVSNPTPTLAATLAQVYGPSDLGTPTGGYLSLMSFTAAPELATAVAPVPAPLIAAPEGSAAGVLAAEGTSTPLEDLLPSLPGDDEDDRVTASLAAPELATDASTDPLVDLAPAAFVLSASLGGLLMAGRRRPG